MNPANSHVHPGYGIACKQVGLTHEGFLVHPDSFARDCFGAALSYTLAQSKPCYSDAVTVAMRCFCTEASVVVFHFLVCSGMLLRQSGYMMQGRKTAAQVQRLEALHAKQQAVLRRKTEEAEAARKRLHVIFHLPCIMACWNLPLSQHRC